MRILDGRIHELSRIDIWSCLLLGETKLLDNLALVPKTEAIDAELRYSLKEFFVLLTSGGFLWAPCGSGCSPCPRPISWGFH